MEAANILQTYLDEVSRSVLADDWETYRQCVALPCHIVSHDESKVVSTEDDLRAGFDQFRDTLRINRITDYVRLVVRPNIAREKIDQLLTADIGQSAEQVHAAHILVDSLLLAPGPEAAVFARRARLHELTLADLLRA